MSGIGTLQGNTTGVRSAKMPRVTPVAVFVLLATCFALSLGTFIALGAYAHPAKDDYLSAVMFRDLDVWESLRLQYRLHNGRLFSALIMRFSPLQFHSLGGYKTVCAGFVLLFAGSLFLYLNFLLKNRLHAMDRAAIFFAVYLSLHLAFGNVAEVYFWLPAISCYGAAAVLFLLLLRLLPAALRNDTERRPAYVAAAVVTVAGICFCAEPGAIMSGCALCMFAFHERQHGRLSVGSFALISIALASAFVIAAGSPGNALRMATSAYGRGALQTFAGGAYSLSGDLMRLLSAMIPVLIFIAATFLQRFPGAFIRKREFLRSLLLILCFSFAAELLAFYGLGGMAALRVRNSIVFLGSVLLLAGGLRAAVSESGKPVLRTGLGRLLLAATAVWISLGAFVPGNPVCGGMQDLLSGTAQRYDADMKAFYAAASRHASDSPNLKVSAVRVIPASLFVAQPLILNEELNGWPWLNVKMAAYFGYERIYTDSLAKTPTSDEAFQAWLRNRRATAF